MRFLSIFIVLAGCEQPKSGCTPGASVACACIDGTMGAQSCRADGTYDACVCQGPIGNPPVRDMSDDNQPVPIHDLAMPVSSGGDKRVFITSTAYVGSAVTDACSVAAAAANLGGTWTAWLSTDTQDAIDRVTGNGPWKRLDGVVVFNNHANLATQPLAQIVIDENGDLVDGFVWTGTNTGGRKATYTCGSWTSGSVTVAGTYGRLDLGAQSWSAYNDMPCDNPLHVYCLEN
jgi:hypothetical protein